MRWVAEPTSRREQRFFACSTLWVARELLGDLLVARSAAGVTCGRIVETEAYLGGDDLASHAARLKHGNVAAMSGPPGIAYVYRSYGIHVMLNVVCEPAGQTGAVLLRALAPLTGLDLMRERRGVTDERLLCRGPGRLCQALDVTLGDHGLDLTTSDRLWIEPGRQPAKVASGRRIGITRGTESPWRFFDADSPFVSAHRRGESLREVDGRS